jgi:pyruvate/2-oxoglutarate dehydrogenase complex dihydrolipoamide dehydrogenase (E3) component
MIMEPERFDAIVLGTGQAGKPLALDLGGAGRRTAVVERQYVGGTCINVGCTPTKTMVASARVAYLARRAADYGVRCGPVAVDNDASPLAQSNNRGRLPNGGAAPAGEG